MYRHNLYNLSIQCFLLLLDTTAAQFQLNDNSGYLGHSLQWLLWVIWSYSKTMHSVPGQLTQTVLWTRSKRSMILYYENWDSASKARHRQISPNLKEYNGIYLQMNWWYSSGVVCANVKDWIHYFSESSTPRGDGRWRDLVNALNHWSCPFEVLGS